METMPSWGQGETLTHAFNKHSENTCWVPGTPPGAGAAGVDKTKSQFSHTRRPGAQRQMPSREVEHVLCQECQTFILTNKVENELSGLEGQSVVHTGPSAPPGE